MSPSIKKAIYRKLMEQVHTETNKGFVYFISVIAETTEKQKEYHNFLLSNFSLVFCLVGFVVVLSLSF